MKIHSNPTIAVLGSHSALDVCRGAKDEGYNTLVVAQKGRDKTYTQMYKSHGKLGCVDDVLIVDTFPELLTPAVQKKLLKKNSIFIPHRSFEVYLNFDYDAIEHDFEVPMFGNRALLRIEERGTKPNQYDLLDAAHIRYPKQFTDPHDIDCLCLVKVLEKERGFERAFYLVNDYKSYKKETDKRLKEGKFTKEQLDKCVIEEFVLGTQVNFNFFYSPIHNRLELLGTDTRRQTNLDGLLRLPSNFQGILPESVQPSYEEAGHIAVTVLESLLEQAYEMGSNFVKATQKTYAPGVIGPFALQTIVTAGPPKKDIIVIDVSPRVPGSPGISATPYSSYLFGKPVSVGRRIAMEIKEGLKTNKINTILT